LTCLRPAWRCLVVCRGAGGSHRSILASRSSAIGCCFRESFEVRAVSARSGRSLRSACGLFQTVVPRPSVLRSLSFGCCVVIVGGTFLLMLRRLVCFRLWISSGIVLSFPLLVCSSSDRIVAVPLLAGKGDERHSPRPSGSAFATPVSGRKTGIGLTARKCPSNHAVCLTA
jgi:hypothetical protein